MDMERVMELLLVFEEKINSHYEKVIASQDWTVVKIAANLEVWGPSR
jgi:hypothetical protein